MLVMFTHFDQEKLQDLKLFKVLFLQVTYFQVNI